MGRILIRLACTVVLLFGTGAGAQNGTTVLYLASERLSDLALGYSYFPQFAKLGFGTPARPWHVWFGGVEMGALVHLPGYTPGAKVDIRSDMLIGNRFNGQHWQSAFEALASFDRDGNGMVESDELRDLYVWIDFDSNGTLATREDALRPAGKAFAGFDLRMSPKSVNGHARPGRLSTFSVLVPRGSRRHLLELDVDESHATRHTAYLSRTSASNLTDPTARTPFSGEWTWSITNADQWKDATRPWGKEAGGPLILIANKGRISGIVQYVGPYGDHINLPLEGNVLDGSAQWTSVSPLGLTRSEVRLESLFGRPVLRARSWSNRNGKIREWTWEARYERQID